MIERAGSAADQIGSLTTALTILGTVVFIAFAGALGYALLRRRDPSARLTPEADPRTIRAILLSGAVVPTLLLVPLLLWTMQSLRQLHPDTGAPDLVLEVTAHQWWWEVRYRDTQPARSFLTANEIHVPVGARVELRLRSPDVIHSFWVPALQGKTDHIPGRENVTWIQATVPGVYRGQCAEFCGAQHANMALLVIAEEPAAFATWAERQRTPAEPPGDSLARDGGRQFLASGCALCHTVRGTSAGGNAGPDLTHVASRRTIAAGRLTNTPANLALWISNPQAVKPGSRMPAVPLPSERFTLIHRYLQQLH